jgi:hypothetical protein
MSICFKERKKIFLNNIKYRLRIIFDIPDALRGFVGLLSSNSYILIDSDGVYLTDKKEE